MDTLDTIRKSRTLTDGRDVELFIIPKAAYDILLACNLNLAKRCDSPGRLVVMSFWRMYCTRPVNTELFNTLPASITFNILDLNIQHTYMCVCMCV